MKKITTLACALFLASGLYAKTIYVTTDGNNTNDGLSWTTAVKDLSIAYDKASANDDIWMAGGTYTIMATVNMKDGVDVYGGFQKGDAGIDARVRPNASAEPWKFTNETAITTGMPVAFRPFDRVDKNVAWAGATIDGIAFKDIETTDGRVGYFNDGVTLQNSSVINCACKTSIMYFERNGIIRNCLFENNYELSGQTTSVVQLRGSKEDTEKGNTLENSIFRNNRCLALNIYNTAYIPSTTTETTYKGEALPSKHYVKNVSFIDNRNICLSLNNKVVRPVEIFNCLFEGNEFATAAATTAAGNVITGGTSGTVDIVSCIIRNNKNTVAADGDWKNALIYLDGMSKMINCLVANNSSTKLLFYCVGNIINSTIANNEGSVFGSLSSSFINNAILGNTPTADKTVFDSDSNSGSYLVNNAILDSEITQGGDLFEVIGSVTADMSVFTQPTIFVGTSISDTQKTEIKNADFTVVVGSACANAGDVEMATEYVVYGDNQEALELFKKDLAGNPRLSGTMINIGAYQGSLASAIELKKVEEDGYAYGEAGSIVVCVANKALVQIYNETGVQVASTMVEAGESSISLNNSGLYLVRVGNKTLKVIVRK